ncbi:hypothetical protein BKA69DRAFT_1104538 [Paraphysoderma sedebokerense]|nr:hypothetical protein BKA69DRAFT_1106326 [Paraphysoderma sedebokerense]KAI9136391.1 hypothetical protein BKA69DRAFT_1104538 [Paraphysoderma sedebokerense]
MLYQQTSTALIQNKYEVLSELGRGAFGKGSQFARKEGAVLKAVRYISKLILHVLV